MVREFKKKKPPKKLLKMAFKHDRKYGPHKWESCAWDKFGKCHGMKAVND